MHKARQRCFCALAIAAALLITGSTFAQPDLRLVELGEIGFEPDPVEVRFLLSSTPTGTFGLNNDTSGQPGGHPPAAVFTVEDGSDFRAFVALPLGGYDEDPGIYELVATGETKVVVHDINDNGVAVGHVGGVTTGQGEAVYWDLTESPPWTATSLAPLPPGSGWSRAVAVSNDDPAVAIVQGQATRDSGCSCSGEADSFYVDSWRVELVTGVLQYDELTGPGCTSETIRPDRAKVGRDIADAADGVAGHTDWADTFESCPAAPCEGDGPDRAVHWSGVTPQVLEDINDGEDVEAQARGINSSGNLVGFARLGSGAEQCEKRAHFWAGPSAVFVNLGNVMPPQQGGEESHAEAVNAADPVQAVGWDEDALTSILWINEGESFDEEDWEAYDLHSRILGSHPETIPQAHDINDQGWIIVYALLDGDPDQHFAWLLIPRGG